jgi:hypothetical protein
MKNYQTRKFVVLLVQDIVKWLMVKFDYVEYVVTKMEN